MPSLMLTPGSALIRVGQTEQALGQIEREYIRRAHDAMIGKSSPTSPTPKIILKNDFQINEFQGHSNGFWMER